MSLVSHPTDDELWQAVLQRSKTPKTSFFYSVSSTGVYCRPGCPARRPKRANVAFHFSCVAAEQAGFRACKRCQPKQLSATEQRAALVLKACRLIESSDSEPDLNTLAESAGMSRFHFHRVFKSVVGITPKAYAKAHRARRVREELGHAPTVTQAIYDAGFNSSGRFYEGAADALGMKPVEFQQGGPNTVIHFAIASCSLGSVAVAATSRGLCAVLLGDEPEELKRNVAHRFPKAELVGGDPNFADLVARVIACVEEPASGLSLPLDVRGTAFQQRVWQQLRRIPAGTTQSYGEIAKAIEKPQASRAVAQACAANPVAVAIPCHRVVRKDGNLSGYRWGTERKRSLLQREAEHRGTRPKDK